MFVIDDLNTTDDNTNTQYIYTEAKTNRCAWIYVGVCNQSIVNSMASCGGDFMQADSFCSQLLQYSPPSEQVGEQYLILL